MNQYKFQWLVLKSLHLILVYQGGRKWSSGEKLLQELEQSIKELGEEVNG